MTGTESATGSLDHASKQEEKVKKEREHTNATKLGRSPELSNKGYIP